MSNPTIKQLRFREYVRGLGCCVSPESWAIQIHHVIGRTAKVKGVGNIGHWFVLPLAWRYHDVDSNDDLNVTHRKHAFEDQFGTQAELFNQVLKTLIHKAKTDSSIDFDDFPPSDVVEAITNYRR